MKHYFVQGFVAYADHALSDPNGRHSTCFLMALDRSAIPDMDALDNALDNVHTEVCFSRTPPIQLSSSCMV
jgi:hypothetical protein